MLHQKGKALDLLVRYLMFSKEEAEILKDNITSISVNSKLSSLDFTILANGCAIFLKRKEGKYEMRVTGKGPIQERTFYLAKSTKEVLLDLVVNNG